MVIVVALAGVPVWRLTRPAAADTPLAPVVASPPANTAAAKAAPLDVEAVFAPAPVDFQIKNLGQTVLAGRGTQTRFTARWAASIPPDGVDLVVQAHWPALAAGTDTASAPTGAGPAATRITVRFPDGREVEKSFWAAANGTLTDVLTLPGTAQPTDTP